MRSYRTWIALLAFASASHADERDFHGTVTRVFDGDSFIVVAASENASRREVEVRLADIDAPEKDQPYADSARSALTKLIEGRRVFVDVIDADKYGRKVAKIHREPDRLDVIRALVHDGHVWVNRRFAKDRSLAPLEDGAKSKQVGLWALAADERVPPWEFRKSQRIGRQQGVTSGDRRKSPVENPAGQRAQK